MLSRYSSMISSLLLAGAVLLGCLTARVWAGSTVICSTTTYSTTYSTDVAKVALPDVGGYMFDLVAESSGTVDTWGLVVYLQQAGISGGGEYTIRGSTFTTCNSNCTQFVTPDVYLGGKIHCRYVLDSGSVTLRVTARQVSP